ncbi:MAG: hypothetical protein WC848_00985 [Parcubacteria group bacterium]|jgi:xanthine/uracil permease
MRSSAGLKKIFLLVGLMLMPTFSVQAFCPVCVVAVGAGLELSHYLGIDDTVTGLWIGALLVGLSAWTLEWLKKKKINFRGEALTVYAGYYLLTIIPLYFVGLMGQAYHTFWGVDKLLLGIIFGSVVFYFGGMWHFKLKKNNNNKVYFPFQKVAVPVGFLLLLSIAFYFLTRS